MNWFNLLKSFKNISYFNLRWSGNGPSFYRSLFILFLSFIFGFFSLASCSKSNCNKIPDTRVMQTVSMVQYPQLRIPSGAVSLDYGGVAGLIVVNLGNNKYIAYDRCSPVDAEKRCAVQLEDNGLTAYDPCSKARFILNNGAPADISECPLKPYLATRQGENIIVTH